jgi:ribosomal protein S12 methylthiotransferase accessory factor
MNRIRPLLGVMGITRIANITGLDRIGLPVVVACRPNSRSLAVSQGKGLDLIAAKVSAVMESIEAYHAESINLPVKLGSYEEMRYTHNVVDVYRLPRSAISPFQPYLPLIWIDGYDLMQGESVWLPFETVHTNYTLTLRVGAGTFNATSNGLASGNHLLEAISHGLCEVVERDATTLWYQLDKKSQQHTRLDLQTVNDPGCRSVLDRYERAGISVAVWETTSDVGISSFLCMIMETFDDPLRPLYPTAGMGCHPVRRISLLRALTEAAQSRLTAIAGSRDDLPRSDYERFRNIDLLEANRTRMEHEGLLHDFVVGPDWNRDTFEEDVKWELERLRAVGIERVIAVDLTKKEFGIPVVRVVIPGLEGVSSLPDYTPGARARAQNARQI